MTGPSSSPPRFSVVVPTYNRGSLIVATLRSVLSQTFGDYEVIVVDDGSTDDTLAHLRSFGDALQLVVQANAGPGAARNAGAAQARGDYLAFLDSDDLWFPRALETYAAAIERHGTPAFVAGCPFRFRDGDALPAAVDTPLATERFENYLNSGDAWRWWGVSSFVIRRDAFERTGGFVSQSINGEDADLALRLGCEPGFVQIREPATFAYREHSANLVGNVDKSILGVLHLLETDTRGGYPGATRSDAAKRGRILTRHVRPASLESLRGGRIRDAVTMYRATFRRHLAERRWKYLLGFPFLLLRSLLERRSTEPQPGADGANRPESRAAVSSLAERP